MMRHSRLTCFVGCLVFLVGLKRLNCLYTQAFRVSHRSLLLSLHTYLLTLSLVEVLGFTSHLAVSH